MNEVWILFVAVNDSHFHEMIREIDVNQMSFYLYL